MYVIPFYLINLQSKHNSRSLYIVFVASISELTPRLVVSSECNRQTGLPDELSNVYARQMKPSILASHLLSHCGIDPSNETKCKCIEEFL